MPLADSLKSQRPSPCNDVSDIGKGKVVKKRLKKDMRGNERKKGREK